MRKTLFSITAPKAKEVVLVGDFTGRQSRPLMMDRMKPRSRTFAAAVNLPPGSHQYKFIVDGEWVEDPKAECVPNEFGTHNSIVTVST